MWRGVGNQAFWDGDGASMNPGEMSRETSEDAELGEALHHRLSQLAARLERLTGGRDTNTAVAESDDAVRREPEIAAKPAPAPRRTPPATRTRAAPVNPSTAEQREAASLSEIAAALRDLDREAGPKVEAPPPPSVDPRAAESKLRAIRQRIDALKARSARAEEQTAREPAAAAPDEADATPPRNARAPVGEATAAIAAATEDAVAARRRRAADFNAAIAEIAARQKMIDESAHATIASPPTAMQATAPAPAHTDDSALSESISELRQRVDELSRAAAKPPAPLPAPQAAVPSAPPPGESVSDAMAALGRQLEEIQGQLRGPEDSVAAFGSAQAVILERLDKLIERAAEPGLEAIAQEILHRVPSGDRFDALATEIDGLSERIATADPRAELGRIDERLSAFEQRLGASTQQSDISARIEAEMSGIRDAVEGLANMLHNGGGPALTRLEGKLDEVSERFQAMLAGAPRADTVTDLLKRLETIADRSETAPAALQALASEIAELRARERSELANLDAHIQTLAQRLDEAIIGQSQGGAMVGDFEARLASLTRRLDELAEADPSAERQAELAQVEDQITQLSMRLDRVDAADQAPEGLAQLEQQVASLMSRLELLATDHDTLRHIQDNLTRIETAVFDSDAHSLDAIQKAAREAVEELGGLSGSKDSALVEDLKADLRTLQDAAHSTDQQTAATLEAVHVTLDRVVARLGNLESEVRGRPQQTTTAVAASEPAPAPRQPSAREEARRPAPSQPGEPLLPGSRRPQPAAIPSGDRDRRADFIAAARRAAQAAAAEHNAIRRVSADAEPAEQTEGPGAFARLRRMVGDHRRPLLIAVGAVVLAIAVIQIVRPFGAREAAPEAPTVAAPATPETNASPAAALSPAAGPIVIEVPAPVAADPTADVAPPNASAAAYIPPVGVTSPVVAQTATTAPAAAAPSATTAAPAAPTTDAAVTYPMPDEAIGTARLRVAAAAGDPAALYEVGARYAEGRGVDRDMAQAAIWLERAANAGLAVAEHRLATLYEAGLGVPENRQTAYDWYLAAADQGNVLAMHNLGVMLSQGIDGTPDFAGAVQWFTAAADHGIRDSQYNLGVIYARGIGVDPDLSASYKWFALAAAQGDTDAAARRDDVASALTPDQLAAARAAVSAWQIQGAPAAANTVAEPDGGWDAPDDRAALDQQDLVRTIQDLLAQEGYDPGPADGVAGPMTRDAVRAFQQSIGVQPTGVIDQDLLRTLTNRDT